MILTKTDFLDDKDMGGSGGDRRDEGGNESVISHNCQMSTPQ